MTDVEEWREIPGYEGRYAVSSHGRVKSLPFWANNRWGPMLRGEKLRDPRPNARGYMSVDLSDGAGAVEKVRVHRLVLLAFVGPPSEDAPHALHKDDDRANNHVSNLYWGSQAENMRDVQTNGLNYQINKKVCPLGHHLVAPNLPAARSEDGKRSCLACTLTANSHRQDELAAEAGRPRQRSNRGRDGFKRCLGEAFEDEAHRRYAHIMRNYEGGL